MTKLLWGPALHAERYALVSWIFLRLFGVIYVSAFASLGVQILGLVGHDGILPAANYFAAVHRAYGDSAYWKLPSLFWLNSSDYALLAGTVAGVLLEIAGGRGPVDATGAHGPVRAVPLLYLCRAGVHGAFSVDSLLVETGFWPYSSPVDRKSWSGSSAGWSFGICFWRAS